MHSCLVALLLAAAPGMLARLKVSDPAPKLSILIYRAETVAPADLHRAEALAAAILRRAGIETSWRAATPDDLAPRPDEIPVHLLSAKPSNWSRDANGYAILLGDASYAGIFCPAVRASAAALDAPEPTVLAGVIAHELGHILLRSRDHTTNGVMVAHLGWQEIQSAQRGELQFLRAQAHRMRAEALRRTRISQPAASSTGRVADPRPPKGTINRWPTTSLN